jgi:hypothetical protein
VKVTSVDWHKDTMERKYITWVKDPKSKQEGTKHPSSTSPIDFRHFVGFKPHKKYVKRFRVGVPVGGERI